MPQWFRVLDLKSGSPWCKSSAVQLYELVLSNHKFNTLILLCNSVNSQMVSSHQLHWDSYLFFMFYLLYLVIYLHHSPQFAQQCYIFLAQKSYLLFLLFIIAISYKNTNKFMQHCHFQCLEACLSSNIHVQCRSIKILAKLWHALWD